MKKFEKEIKKQFPKSTKVLSYVVGIIVLIFVFFFYIQQIKVELYIKDNYGNNVLNIFKDNGYIENISLKRDDKDGRIYLWYVAEDSGKIEILKENDEYHISILSSVLDDKIQIYPVLDIEKQNPNKLYRVTRVVDGDTIKIEYNNKQHSVRLIGIDTPESVHPDSNKNLSEGKIASEYTRNRLENKEIRLEFDVQSRDKYNRLLAYVYLDGKMFNEELLEKGYAKLATYPPNVKYVDRFTKVQKKAIKNNVGFWNESIWEKEI